MNNIQYDLLMKPVIQSAAQAKPSKAWDPAKQIMRLLAEFIIFLFGMTFGHNWYTWIPRFAWLRLRCALDDGLNISGHIPTRGFE